MKLAVISTAPIGKKIRNRPGSWLVDTVKA